MCLGHHQVASWRLRAGHAVGALQAPHLKLFAVTVAEISRDSGASNNTGVCLPAPEVGSPPPSPWADLRAATGPVITGDRGGPSTTSLGRRPLLPLHSAQRSISPSLPTASVPMSPSSPRLTPASQAEGPRATQPPPCQWQFCLGFASCQSLPSPHLQSPFNHGQPHAHRTWGSHGATLGAVPQPTPVSSVVGAPVTIIPT